MKVFVVGTGSIGRRHISNLLHLGIDVAAYSYRGRAAVNKELDDRVVLLDSVYDGLSGDFDAVIIANSTELHIDIALEAARMQKAIYIEKPLSLSLRGVEELACLIDSHRLIVESGFMLRAHPNLLWIKKYLDDGFLGELTHLRTSVGQWLPDWRPGTDHRRAYSAFRKKGGGVIFDLIHELDLVHWLGGPVTDVSAMTRNIPMLEIQTEAVAQINLRLDSGLLAQVHLDYIRPGYSRTLEIVGAKGVLSWDYSRGEVCLGLPDGSVSIVHKTPINFNRNSMFLVCMAHFLHRIVEVDTPALSSFQDGLSALRVALSCHQSMFERRNIRPDEVDSSFELMEIF